MKRIFSALCAAVALLTMCLAFPVAAEEVVTEAPPVVTDIVVTDEFLAQGETVTGLYDSTGTQTRAANLQKVAITWSYLVIQMESVELINAVFPMSPFNG